MPRRPVLVVLATLVLFLLGACEAAEGLLGGDDAAAGADTAARVDVGGAGEDVPEAPPDDAAARDTAVPPPDESTGEDAPIAGPVYGVVALWEARSSALNRAGASADFRREPVIEDPELGRCVVVAVDPTQALPPPASLDAGALTIDGALQPVTLGWSAALPGGGQGYASNLDAELEQLLPGAGTVVTATATGGADVPGFTASVATPAPVSISEPSAGLFGSVAGDAALPIRWNAADGETTVISLNVIDGQYEAVAGDALVCTLDGDPGQFTVPAMAMAELPRGASYRVVIGVTRVRSATVDVAGGAVTFTVSASGGVYPFIQ